MKFLAYPMLLAGIALSIGCATTAPMTKEAQARVTSAEALERLKSGNERFTSGRPAPRNLLKQVAATSEGQYPFATVVSCLDSRTSAELIFDQGIGDIFNARVAGNVVNPDILGSLEFASKAAGSKLIAVIGHTKCGAVKGACDHVQLGNLTGLLNRIQPAVKSTASSPGEDRSAKNDAFVDRVAETNVRTAMETIRRQSPILREMERKGEIAIVGGMHDLETGRVTFLK
jgi:carbonic anhydrase